MASFRRTLSPHHHDRAAAVNGGVCSPSPLSKSAAAPPSLLAALRLLLLGLLLPRHSRKIAGAGGAPPPWKPSLYRFFFCFVLGLLLGFTPFFNLSEIKPAGDFAFESRSSSASGSSSVRTPEEIVHAELRTKRDPRENFGGEFGDRKLLIVVTPTYNRAFQAFYLNRLGQTLRLVAPPLLWVVVESEAATDETAEVLRKSGVMYRHVVSKKNLTDIKDRGVNQRNAALELIELHRLDGIVYFADDDNAYSLELFDRMREIKRFGTWPVAMLAQGKAKAILEGPVCNGTQVIGWHTNEKSKRLRRFHIDMSGFAFNSTILWDPKRWNRPTSAPIQQLDSVKEGFQETTFIEQIVEDESQMEGLPHGCLRIMNWHLHIESSNLVYPSGWLLEKTLNAVIPLKS